MARPLALVLLAACASAPPQAARREPGSRGPHASEHLAAARDEDELARVRAMWPVTHHSDGTGRTDQLLVGVPWRRHWDSPAEHEQAAAAHRSVAARLQADFEHACGSRTGAEIATSPIARYGIGGAPNDHGVVVFLASSAGPPDRLLADIACHRAWMMLAPSGMDECPFDLDGIHVDATGDELGITLQITIDDPALVPELRRRAAKDLELHAQR